MFCSKFHWFSFLCLGFFALQETRGFSIVSMRQKSQQDSHQHYEQTHFQPTSNLGKKHFYFRFQIKSGIVILIDIPN